MATVSFNRPQPLELMELFLRHAHRWLLEAPGAECRAYLQRAWGIPADRLPAFSLGCYTTRSETRKLLSERGFTPQEIDASLLTADFRCEGRLLLPARDETGRLLTVIAQRIDDSVDEPSCLHLKGGRLPTLFGADVALSGPAKGKEHLVIVSERLEALALHGEGILNVAALGSPRERLTASKWEWIWGLGVKRVTLALTREEFKSGRLRSHIDQWASAKTAPALAIADPDRLEVRADWCSLLRTRGRGDFDRALDGACPAFRFQALRILAEHCGESNGADAQRDAVLREASRFAAKVPASRREELRQDFWPVVDECIPCQTLTDGVTGRDASRIAYWETSPPRTPLVSLRPAPPRVAPEEAPEEAPAEALGNGVVTVDRQLPQLHAWLCAKRPEADADGRVGLPQHTLPRLDRTQGGLRGFVLLAGEPGAGKSSLALQCTVDAVMYREDVCALYVSRTLSRERLLERIASRLSGTDWKNLARPIGEESAADNWEEIELRIMRTEQELSSIGRRLLLLDGRAKPLTIEHTIDQLEALKKQSGCARALIVVDDLQAWPAEGQEERKREEWRTDRVRQLGDLAGVQAVLGVWPLLQSPRRFELSCGGTSVGWQQLFANVRAASAPDSVWLLRQLEDADLLPRVGACRFPTVAMRRWRESLRQAGVSPIRLNVVKCGDGAERVEIEFSFRHRQSSFREGICLPPTTD